MKRLVSCFLIVILCVLLLSSCVDRKRGGPTLSVSQPTSVPSTTANTENVPSLTETQPSETVSQTESTTAVITTEPVSTTANTTNEKMVFSSDPENIFITAVVSRYGVNASNLVAYYASSQSSNGNLVYEFDGTLGSDGRPVRTKETLKSIYTVSAPPELLAKKASGTAAEGKEYDEKDTKLCQFFTEQVVFRFFAKDLQNA